MRFRAQTPEPLAIRRHETKYFLDPERAQSAVQALSGRLPTKRLTDDETELLPGARHYVTTIYFDNAERDLYREAMTADDSISLRAREYYDFHAHLAEVATDPRQMVRFEPVLWLEMKHKRGTLTGKRRVGIPKREVPSFLAQGLITEKMVRIQEEAYGAEGKELLHDVAERCRRYGAPLRADSLVNYRRIVFGDPSQTLRITMDLEIAYFVPPDDLWMRDHALVRPTLGTPALVEPRPLVEVKSQALHDPWLATLLAEHGAKPTPYSKFETASQVAHG